MANKSDSLISIIIPCFNEQEVFPHLRERLQELTEKITTKFRLEILLIDDGSSDGTWKQMQTYAKDDSHIRAISFSKNFGHQMALTCGYDLARGDAMVSLDADLQDPPEVILEMIEKWQEGADVVFAIRKQREGETFFKKATAAFFYRAIRAMGANTVKRDCGDFRLMSRRSIEALNKVREQHRFIRGLAGWVGFETAEVYFERKSRKAGVTKYPLNKMIRFAVDAILSFSIFPLRITFYLAFISTAVVLSYLGYVFINYFIFGRELVAGWTSLLLSIMAFGAINLVCMGIMGEYVGRIFEQVKNRPLYLIKDQTKNE